jgi:hypothetical protein
MIQELNVTVYANEGQIEVQEGSSGNAEQSRCFTLIYPDARITIWVVGAISTQDMSSVLRNAVAYARQPISGGRRALASTG